MILNIAIPALIAIIVFVVGELLRRQLGGSNEWSRKLVHSLHGAVIISWLFLTNEHFIIYFELFFIVAVLGYRLAAHRWSKQIGWMYKVNRPSWGEFFYPLGVIVSLLLTDNKWFIVLALLQLAITDSVAALVGKAYGKGNQYKVFGTTKSVAGTTAFIVVAALLAGFILIPTGALSGTSLVAALIFMPFVLAVAENVGMQGSDNFLLPVVTVAFLHLVS